MSNFLGILELALWIIAVIAIAAGITYTVVRLAPKRKPETPGPTSASETT